MNLIRRSTAVTATQRPTSNDGGSSNSHTHEASLSSSHSTTPLTSPPSSPMSPLTASTNAAANGQFQKRWREENHLRQHRPLRDFLHYVRFDMPKRKIFRKPPHHGGAANAFPYSPRTLWRQKRTWWWFGILLFLVTVVTRVMTRSSSNRRHYQFAALRPPQGQQPPSILLSPFVAFPSAAAAAVSKKPALYFPRALSDKAHEDAQTTDYGGLYVYVLQEDGVPRAIYRDYKLDEGASDVELPQRDRADRDDDVQDYYAYDDDYVRNQYIVAYPGSGSQKHPTETIPDRHCRRTNWHKSMFPTCNTLHELAMEYPSSRPKYLSYGAYRDVFTVDHHYANITDTLVLKQYRQDLQVSYDSYEYIRVDALISERLSYSPRIADIYTFCGLGIVAEFFRHGDAEAVIFPHYRHRSYTTTDPTVPQNNLSGSEKLRIALDMAEAIADLHGFEGGVIVHNDIQPSQFLYGGDARHRLKLNDFNRAEIMLWEGSKKEYCLYREGYGRGNYRSPEEYLNQPINEKIDVYSFGNNLYGLLTGRYIYHELHTDDEAKTQVRHGVQATIDPIYETRSYAEGKLVQMIRRCWEYYAKDRADIFEMITTLREAIAENDRLERQGLHHAPA